MRINMNTLENCFSKVTLTQQQSHPGCIPNKNVFIYALKDLKKNAHSSTIQNSTKLEMAEMLINR